MLLRLKCWTFSQWIQRKYGKEGKYNGAGALFLLAPLESLNTCTFFGKNYVPSNFLIAQKNEGNSGTEFQRFMSQLFTQAKL